MNSNKDDKNSQGPTNEELSDAALDKVVGGMASPEPTSLRRKGRGDNDDLSAGTPGQVLFNDSSLKKNRSKGDNDDNASGGTPGQIGFGDMA